MNATTLAGGEAESTDMSGDVESVGMIPPYRVKTLNGNDNVAFETEYRMAA